MLNLEFRDLVEQRQLIEFDVGFLDDVFELRAHPAERGVEAGVEFGDEVGGFEAQPHGEDRDGFF
jgi:hypothetical protein